MYSVKSIVETKCTDLKYSVHNYLYTRCTVYITNFTIGVQSKEYSGDQVYRLEVQTPNQIEYLQNLENNGADFWTEVLITINFAPRPSFQILLYSVFSVR